jgi:hypothetical protein
MIVLGELYAGVGLVRLTGCPLVAYALLNPFKEGACSDNKHVSHSYVAQRGMACKPSS